MSGVKKTACGCCGAVHRSYYDRKVRRVRDLICGDMRIYLEVEIRRVQCRECGKVKQEKIPWIAGKRFYTKRFAWYVGRRCRDSSIKDVARELRLDWKTVKDAPAAAILYDKFHVMRHIGDALEKVRKMEYKRLSGKDRS